MSIDFHHQGQHRVCPCSVIGRDLIRLPVASIAPLGWMLKDSFSHIEYISFFLANPGGAVNGGGELADGCCASWSRLSCAEKKTFPHVLRIIWFVYLQGGSESAATACRETPGYWIDQPPHEEPRGLMTRDTDCMSCEHSTYATACLDLALRQGGCVCSIETLQVSLPMSQLFPSCQSVLSPVLAPRRALGPCAFALSRPGLLNSMPCSRMICDSGTKLQRVGILSGPLCSAMIGGARHG